MKFWLLFLPLSLAVLPAGATFVCPSPLQQGSLTTVTGNVKPGSTCQFTVVYGNINTTNTNFGTIDVTISGATTETDSFILTDMFGNSIQLVGYGSLIQFAAPPPSVNITIFAGANSTMVVGVNITTKAFRPFAGTSGGVTSYIYEGSELVPLRDSGANLFAAFVSKASVETPKIYLNFAVPDTSSFDLMNAFVYDGQKEGARLLGTLNNLKNTPIVSSGDSITIYYAYGVPMGGSLFVADESSVVAYPNLNVLWANKNSNKFQNFEMNAENGTALVVLVGKLDYSDTVYLDSIQFQTANSTVSVYAQKPLSSLSEMYLLANYTNANVKNALPQHLDSYVRTFVMTKGRANIRYTIDPAQVNITQPFIGRTGFIATRQIGEKGDNQFSQEFRLLADYNFTLSLIPMDFPVGQDRAYLTVANMAQPRNSLFIPLIDAFMNYPVSMTGRTFGVDVSTKAKYSATGTILTFSVNAVDPNNGVVATSTAASQTSTIELLTTASNNDVLTTSQFVQTTTSPQTTTKGVAVLHALTSYLATLLLLSYV